ncbi:MAG: phosphotransferase [Chloroflexi bacterium]|nr:phosphotransferase [Chloroflexota bacterium]
MDNSLALEDADLPALGVILNKKAMLELTRQYLLAKGAQVEHWRIAHRTYSPRESCTVSFAVALRDDARAPLQQGWVVGRLYRTREQAETAYNQTRALVQATDTPANFWQTQVVYLDTQRLVLQVFAFDHELPGLVSATNMQSISQRLAAFLPPARLANPLRIEPLRYRPGHRCVLRYDLGPAQHIYGKVFPPANGKQTFQLMQALHASVDRDALLVAEPIAFFPEHSLLVQSAVPGRSLKEILRDAPDPGAAQAEARQVDMRAVLGRVAQALATLHRQAPLLGPTYDPIDDLERIEQEIERIASIAPKLAVALNGICLALRRGPAASSSTRCLTHGDFKPSQVLIGATIGLTDFDRAALSDPARDVGNFLASLRQDRAHLAGSAAAFDALAAAFVQAYRDASGAGVDLGRVNWYETCALLRKSVRAFYSSPRASTAAALADAAQARQTQLGSVELTKWQPV